MRVAVLGASPNPERYSNQAVRLLLQHGHEVVPVNPRYDRIEGLDVVPGLDHIPSGSIHTLSVYLGPEASGGLGGAIRTLRPSRVIFNPGTENPTLEAEIAGAGIEVVRACTLVLLRTGQFETGRLSPARARPR